jgi:hypothetical protein
MDMLLGDGPILNGHWYNPKTGDSFTVRDTFFEDNNLICMTTDGRRLDYNMIQNYIQSDKPFPKQTQPVKPDIPDSILSEVMPVDSSNKPLNNNAGPLTGMDTSLMTEDDIALITGQAPKVQANFVDPTKAPTQAIAPVQKDEDVLLIERLLKRASKPSVACYVKWGNFPEKQFEMLDMMAVVPEKIIEYFLQSIDLQALREEVKYGIEKYIYDYFGNEKEIAEFNESFEPVTVVEHVEKTVERPVEKPKAEKKSTQKKTTKKK